MPIVYTSADSVFQIACHEDVYDNERMYEMCKADQKLKERMQLQESLQDL